MATHKVIIKELSVVETLGRCSVLCSDKTGTLTTGKMTVKLLWDTNEYYQVWPRDDYTNKLVQVANTEDVNEIIDDQSNKNQEINEIENDSSLELLLTGAILNNDARLEPIKDIDGKIEYKIIGNFTDGALLVLAMTNGLNIDYIRDRYKQLKKYSFNSELKRMSGLYKDTIEDDFMYFCKGASEVILPRCNRIGDEEKIEPLTREKEDDLLDEIQSLANQGYRVISLAYKPTNEQITYEDELVEREEVESDLIFIGYTILYDPPRPEVVNSVRNLDSAGIFPIMITGDAVQTARTIARQVGILDKDEIVVEGREAKSLSDEEFFKVSVFARVSPKDKEVIVSRYQNRGDVVAMTGDGVNDALAITRADAGIAMGISGTAVAKEASDIIISDDSYVSIVTGVEQGRNLYERIRLMIYFYIAVNLAEAIMYFTTSFQTNFFLLNDWQRVYIFTIVHSMPVLAIIFGPDNEHIMKLKPRQDDELLPRNMVYSLALFSISFGIILLTTYFIYYKNASLLNSINRKGITSSLQYRGIDSATILDPEDMTQAKARTMLLTVVYLVETTFVLIIFRFNRPIWDTIPNELNAYVLSMVFFPLVFHFSLMYIVPLQRFLFFQGIKFELIPLSIGDLGICILLALIPLSLLEVHKYYIRQIKNQQY